MAIAIHDTTYLIDFSVKHIVLDDAMKMGADMIADYVIGEVEKYEHENFSKFIGAGLPTTLKYMSPTLCSRLWLELDIVPVVMRPDDETSKANSFWDVKRVDEQADSMARKCIMYVVTSPKLSNPSSFPIAHIQLGTSVLLWFPSFMSASAASSRPMPASVLISQLSRITRTHALPQHGSR